MTQEQQTGATTFLLFLVFLVLKLTNVIHWSWWWVTAPLWGLTALYLTFAIVCLIFGSLVWVAISILDKPSKHRKRGSVPYA